MESAMIALLIAAGIAALIAAAWLVNKLLKGESILTTGTLNSDGQKVQALINAQMNGGFWTQTVPSYTQLQQEFLTGPDGHSGNAGIGTLQPTAPTTPSSYNWGTSQTIYNAAVAAAAASAKAAGSSSSSAGGGINWGAVAKTALSVGALV